MGEYQEKLIKTINKSDMLMQVFNKVQKMKFDSYYIGAGCITQTVWNDLTNRPLNYGITDIDIIYFDNQDLSFEAEDRIIKFGNELFSEIPIKIDLKNQARVHLWYKDKFGIELQPFERIEQAIDTWPTTATAFGVSVDEKNNWKVYAPYGLCDLFSLIIKANKKLINEEIYMNKATKWKSKWPELKVLNWNEIKEFR